MSLSDEAREQLAKIQPTSRYCFLHDEHDEGCRFCRSGAFETFRRGLNPDPRLETDGILARMVNERWRGLLEAAFDEIRTLNDKLAKVKPDPACRNCRFWLSIGRTFHGWCGATSAENNPGFGKASGKIKTHSAFGCQAFEQKETT